MSLERFDGMRNNPVSKWIKLIVLGAVIFWWTAAGLLAVETEADPMATIKKPIDKVIEILNDPRYKDPDKREIQRERLWETVRGLFDFNEISRRAVARHWKKFSPEEKKRFADVFADFLGNTYIDKIQSEYNNEQIVYVSQIARGNKALVKTKLLRGESLEIPIAYRMKKIDGKWKIYDILVENGVSLVKNYRIQFSEILKKHPPQYLIKRLETKLAEQKKKRAEKNK